MGNPKAERVTHICYVVDKKLFLISLFTSVCLDNLIEDNHQFIDLLGTEHINAQWTEIGQSLE